MIYKFKEYQKPDIISNHLNLGGTDSKGNEIKVNSLYIEENGKPSMGIMGELHFERVPRIQWKTALETMKAGGIDIVATYIIWIYHEQEEGRLDWNGDNDLRAFISLAAEVGLKVCIRIGPWCHGEVRNGGFPDWLLKKPCSLRTNDEEYLKIVKAWYQSIAAQVRGLLYSEGGPIIMCQLENELTEDAEHLMTLKQMAKEVGIDVPLFTVTGWNSVNGAKIPVDDVVPAFGGYCDAPWDPGVKQLPPCARYYFTGIRNDSAIGKDLIKAKQKDGWQLPYLRYPYLTCEIGAGLMNTYHRRYKIHGMDIYAMTLIMLCEGANMLGYYMYHGGINKLADDYTLQESKATGYPNDYPIISYDFQAPISCFEETRESYDLLNLLHLFIHEYGEKLALMTYVEGEANSKLGELAGLRYGVRRDEKSGFIFINNYQRLHGLKAINDVVIDTGTVIFPSIDIKENMAFFMPFNIDLENDVILKYATAQPLCKDGDTWLFMAIPGVTPEFEFENPAKQVDIKLLTMEEAKRLRKVDGRVYFAKHSGKTIEGLEASEDKEYQLVKLDKPQFEIPKMFMDELRYQNKPITWYSLKVQGQQGFVDIELPCDVMQVYVDGQLVTDDFYHGMPFRLPKAILQGEEVFIVCTDMPDNIYME